MWRLAKDSSGGKTSLSRSWRACADSESVLRQCGADKNRGSLLAARKANISTVSLVTCASYALRHTSDTPTHARRQIINGTYLFSLSVEADVCEYGHHKITL